VDFICEVIILIYYLAAQLYIKNKADNTYPVLSQVRIRRYSSYTAPSIVISDYKMSMQYNGNNPIIVGRCNIASDKERMILERSLVVNEMTYDNLLSYKKYFNDGFIISSSVISDDKIKSFITDDMTATPASMIWRVKYSE
jgi:hypothetical protein